MCRPGDVSVLALTLAVLNTVCDDLLTDRAAASLARAVTKTVSEVRVTAEALGVVGLAAEGLSLSEHGVDTAALRCCQ